VTGTLPLDGIRVIDVSRVLAGPFATMLLADLGADVVKVEPPGGDETREWGPPWWGDPADRRSAYFCSVNRNKRGIVLDLRTDAGRATLDRLLAGADLLVHNYRPSTASRLGLDADGLARRHPRLVVASVGGFRGADADRPAYDLLAQAVSGLMSVTGEAEGAPMKVGVALLDLIAGLEMAVGALAALVGRGLGRGQRVEVSLIEAGVTSLINVLGNQLAGSPQARHGNAHPNIAPYQAFEARDGHVVVAVGNDAQFGRLLGVLGLADDGRFATNPRRVERRGDLTAFLASAIASWDRATLVDALLAADVAAGPVNSVAEAVEMMGTDWVEEVGGIRLPPSPIRLGGDRLGARRAPPLLGQHTAEMLAELGDTGTDGA
jgi:crotonobetainyl-CoA:carnitine CoA-transferase CaiB-like acyl-CoA transferase